MAVTSNHCRSQENVANSAFEATTAVADAACAIDIIQCLVSGVWCLVLVLVVVAVPQTWETRGGGGAKDPGLTMRCSVFCRERIRRLISVAGRTRSTGVII